MHRSDHIFVLVVLLQLLAASLHASGDIPATAGPPSLRDSSSDVNGAQVADSSEASLSPVQAAVQQPRQQDSEDLLRRGQGRKKEGQAWDSEASSPQPDRLKSAVCLVDQVNVELEETQRLIEHKYNLSREISEIEEAKRSAEAKLSDLAFQMLLAATKSGETEYVKEALDKGADPFALDEQGMNALQHAAVAQNTEAFELLLSYVNAELD
jgi:hypothetical protein